MDIAADYEAWDGSQDRRKHEKPQLEGFAEAAMARVRSILRDRRSS